MDNLELSIPPLPQFITANRLQYERGFTHFERSFPLYDILYVTHGSFHMTEEGNEYNLEANQLLVLEPFKRHWGHLACPPGTKLYYLHFKHPAPVRTITGGDIQWNSMLPSPNHWDREPARQSMYIPKTAVIEPDNLVPLLEEIVRRRRRFTLENQLPLQALSAQFFMLLQQAVRSQSGTRSHEISRLVVEDLRARIEEPFRLEALANRLNFHIDYLSKCLKKHTGLTPLQYLNRLRMEQAKQLLERSSFTLQEISEKVGIQDYNYFFRLFRKHAGMSPFRYRQQHKR
ncbi:HTH-type transcriptional activator RhaS [Paenibacillus solanacearum]|uniref:HTH-type transcriptional activator RhaS n=1 Tax=Paenibacillus solanacearum TaxID=2048548 RepID=A0A916K9J3_9BACL|nr:helix-turn-helix domain-containing protein [Paenibacillus solanacearum]CAG7649180.1 HTH-type transcriptional activator RhaS [Paenibacillus solanacearum]